MASLASSMGMSAVPHRVCATREKRRLASALSMPVSLWMKHQESQGRELGHARRHVLGVGGVTELRRRWRRRRSSLCIPRRSLRVWRGRIPPARRRQRFETTPAALAHEPPSVPPRRPVAAADGCPGTLAVAHQMPSEPAWEAVTGDCFGDPSCSPGASPDLARLETDGELGQANALPTPRNELAGPTETPRAGSTTTEYRQSAEKWLTRLPWPAPTIHLPCWLKMNSYQGCIRRQSQSTRI